MQKPTWSVIGMVMGGVATLAIVGWLFHVRTSHMLPVAPPAAVGTSGEDSAVRFESAARSGVVTLLAAGTADAIESAAHALEARNRTLAMQSLDAAQRAADVGAHGLAAGAGATFHNALRAVREARTVIQNGGHPVLLPLRRAVNTLRTLDGTPLRGSQAGLAPYEGATVIDAHGVIIGAVASVENSSDGISVRLVLGGVQDFMGFVDVGGRARVFPAAAVVFGQRRAIGSTFVALMEQDPAVAGAQSTATPRRDPSGPAATGNSTPAAPTDSE
jgi:hypothetical protein